MTTPQPPLPAHIEYRDTQSGYFKTTANVAMIHPRGWTPADIHAVHDHMLGHATVALPVEAVEKIRRVLRTAAIYTERLHDSPISLQSHMNEGLPFIKEALALLPKGTP